jgi:P-type Ca2+ transporter type 2C
MSEIFEKGLSNGEAEAKLKQFGPNEIFKPQKISFFGIAKHEITEPMILLLFFVGIVYSIWGKLDDAITIFIVIILLVFAEVYNEFRAKKAISALEEIAAPKAKVLRDGNITAVDSKDIVPGDILVLSPGTKIPADANILRSIDMQIDESSLTGESFPQEKMNGAAVFAGTVVTSGEGTAKVNSTGKDTKLGKIAAAAKQARAPRTPLQLEMRSLAGKLVYVAAFMSILIPVIGWFRGQDLKTMILTGLSLSFATIPEELPIVITMVLGLGAYTLSKHNFLVKRIKAAETLGNATVIVTDKTGTITEGKMRIKEVYPENTRRDILNFAVLATTPFSTSILDDVLMRDAGERKADLDIVRQRNFTNESKTNSVIRGDGGKFTIYMKGAPEKIIDHCGSVDKSAVMQEIKKQTSVGRRLIAVCSRELAGEDVHGDWEKLEQGMKFCGLISFEDTPRKGVRETIARAAGAGVRTIMVTGDHPETAKYIAKEVGILSGDGRVVTGDELDKISDADLRDLVKKVVVFARTEPEHKYRIVKALQENKEVVAVTGDGVNDALALKAADIGIAMGIRGTDVAKEAAEVVLADDNYITITQGIFEGRKFYDNLKKGIKYYLSVKAALIFIFLLPAIAGLPMPLAPIQIILLELFMDLAASAGFVSEPEEKDIYVRSPYAREERIMNAPSVLDVFLKGLVLFCAVTGVYFYGRHLGLPLIQVQTLAFTAWIFGHITLAFISRSDRAPVYKLGFFTNPVINLWALTAITFLMVGVFVPYISEKFNLGAVSLKYFLLSAGFSIALNLILEGRKFIPTRRAARS